jgi:hypothetical protein
MSRKMEALFGGDEACMKHQVKAGAIDKDIYEAGRAIFNSGALFIVAEFTALFSGKDAS